MSRLIKGLMLASLMMASASQAQTVEYIHTDALGSVVAVTNAQRKVQERREYEPYGHQLTPAATNGPGYTGHVQDAATGLVYMQQRYYDPTIGRFLSVDPVTRTPILGRTSIGIGMPMAIPIASRTRMVDIPARGRSKTARRSISTSAKFVRRASHEI